MAIVWDNKTYRNLQEQVFKNMKDIQDIQDGVTVLAEFGIKVVGQVPDVEDLPDPDTYEGEYGDAFIVGEEAPYDYYIFTRAFEGDETPQWFNIGQFPVPGPQGIQGEQGPIGVTPSITNNASITTLLPSQSATISVTQSGTDENPVLTWAFAIPKGDTGLQGPKGDKGDKGDTGETGAQGPQGNDGTTYIILGTVTSSDDLPSPSLVSPRNGAYLVGSSEPYDLYVVIGTSTLEWFNAGAVTVGPRGPQGEQGATGPAPTITASASASALSSVSNPTASVTKSGTDTNPAFAFTFGIPRTSLTFSSNEITGANTVKSIIVEGDAWNMPATPDLSSYVEFSDLATVATTGDYDDLIDKPVIPDAVSGTNDGTNWTSLTIGSDTYALGTGSGSVDIDNKTIIENTDGELETAIGGYKEGDVYSVTLFDGNCTIAVPGASSGQTANRICFELPMYYADLLYQLKGSSWNFYNNDPFTAANAAKLRLTMTYNGATICESLAPAVCADGGKKGDFGTIMEGTYINNNRVWPYIRWWLNDTTGSDRLSLNALADTNNYPNPGNRFYFTYNLNNSSVTPNSSDIVYMKLELVDLDKDWLIGKYLLTPVYRGFGNSAVQYSTSVDGNTIYCAPVSAAEWATAISNNYVLRIAKFNDWHYSNTVLGEFDLSSAQVSTTENGFIVIGDGFTYTHAESGETIGDWITSSVIVNFDSIDHPEVCIYQKYTYETIYPLNGKFIPVDGTTISLNSNYQLQGFSGDYNDLTNKPTIPVVSYPVTEVQVNGASVLNGTIAEIPAITSVSGVNDGTNWTSLTIGSDTYGIGGGSAPSNMVTTDTTQTITGIKIIPTATSSTGQVIFGSSTNDTYRLDIFKDDQYESKIVIVDRKHGNRIAVGQVGPYECGIVPYQRDATGNSWVLGLPNMHWEALYLEKNPIYSDLIVLMKGLPTADPLAEGQLWNDNGVLKVSSGS